MRSVSTGGLRSASMALTLTAGMRPVVIQKSTVAVPTPCRLGPMEAWPFGATPLAWDPWQLEQVWSKSSLPAWACEVGGLV